MTRNVFEHYDNMYAAKDKDMETERYLSYNTFEPATVYPFLRITKTIEGNQVIAQQFFTLNLQENKRSRQVLTIFDVLAEIGGFLGFLSPLGAFISGLFQERLKNIIVASQLFKVDPDLIKDPNKNPE